MTYDPKDMTNQELCDEMAGNDNWKRTSSEAGELRVWEHEQHPGHLCYHPFPFDLSNIADPKMLPDGWRWGDVTWTGCGIIARAYAEGQKFFTAQHRGSEEPRTRLVVLVMAWRKHKADAALSALTSEGAEG